MRLERILFGDDRPSTRGWLIGLIPAVAILALTYALTDSPGLTVLGSVAAAIVLRIVAYRAAPLRRGRGPWS